MARSKQRCVVMAVNSIRQGFQLGRFWVGSFWLLAFILAFVVRSSYGYGAGAIALTGILSLFTWRQMPPLSQATRQWSLLLLVYVGLMLLFLYAGDEPIGAYERLGRYLLAVPLVIAIWRWRPSMHCYAISLVLGIAAAFTVVFIARVIQGKDDYGNGGLICELCLSAFRVELVAIACSGFIGLGGSIFDRRTRRLAGALTDNGAVYCGAGRRQTA